MPAQTSCLYDYRIHIEEDLASQNASQNLRRWAVDPNIIESASKADPLTLLNLAIRCVHPLPYLQRRQGVLTPTFQGT